MDQRLNFTGPFFLVFCLAMSPSMAFAQQKNVVETSAITTLKTDLSKTEHHLNAVNAELAVADKRIAKISKRLHKIRLDIKKERKQLQQLREEKSQLLASTSNNKQSLTNHIKAAYMMGRQPFVKMMLNQEDPAVAGRMLVYFDYFSRAYTSQIETLTRRSEEVEKIEARLEQHTQLLAKLLEKNRTELAALGEKKAERTALAKSLSLRKEDISITLNRLLKDQQKLEQLTENVSRTVNSKRKPRASGTGFANLKGSLRWPVEGKLVGRFGKSRLGSGQLSWRGVLIEAEEGIEVQVVAPGQIVFSDWLRGYGYVTIVDHSGGYLSLYGHNETLLKEVGEFVVAGDVVAIVGKTGAQEMPGLYFEIRRNGEPINPQAWIARR